MASTFDEFERKLLLSLFPQVLKVKDGKTFVTLRLHMCLGQQRDGYARGLLLE